MLFKILNDMVLYILIDYRKKKKKNLHHKINSFAISSKINGEDFIHVHVAHGGMRMCVVVCGYDV